MLQRLKRHWWRFVAAAFIFGTIWPMWELQEVYRQWNVQLTEIDGRWDANSEQVRSEAEVLLRAKREKDQLESALKLVVLQAEKVEFRRDEIETSRRLFNKQNEYIHLILLFLGIGLNISWIGPTVSRFRAKWRLRRANRVGVNRVERWSDGENPRNARNAAGEEERLMGETEWQEASNPTRMFGQTVLTSDRKLRLFATACCRRVWDQLPGLGSRQAVEVAEQYADGEATPEELDAALENAEAFASAEYGGIHIARFAAERHIEANDCAFNASLLHAESLVQNGQGLSVEEVETRRTDAIDTESAAQADLLREIFGNPFRPVTFDPAWRTSTITALAQQMYDSRDFSAMPILADALQDAGCENADILTHCRGPGPHVRGCWVVDLVLGKE